MYFLIKDNEIFGYQEPPSADKSVIMVVATENQNKNIV